jgi:hypothetical protein
LPRDIQDRDGGILLLAPLFCRHPFLKTLFADAGYQGRQFQQKLADILPSIAAEIIKLHQAKGFVHLPSVGLSSAPLRGSTAVEGLRRKNLNRSGLAFLRLASIRLMLAKALQSNLMFPDGLSTTFATSRSSGSRGIEHVVITVSSAPRDESAGDPSKNLTRWSGAVHR